MSSESSLSAPPFGRALLVACAVVIPALLNGCTADETPTMSGPYAANFESAFREATTDLERTALSDGELTYSEYKEAAEAFVQCQADQGIDVELVPVDGVFNYTYNFKVDDATDRVIDACRLGTVNLIEPLFVDALINPENSDFLALVADCLVRNSLANAMVTRDDIEALLLIGEAEREVFAASLGIDLADAETNRCLSRPHEVGVG